ncbi:MAG: alanine:cation symporter family protein [Nitrosomonas sp.]|nr:alanine:cation symporter family protein [Nitrosomonas sp.]
MCQRIVPVMAIIYIIAGLVVIGVHYGGNSAALRTILRWQRIRSGIGALRAHY